MSVPNAFGNRAALPAKFRPVAVVVAAMLVPVALWGWLAFDTRANVLAAALADERRVTEAVGVHTLKLLESQIFALALVAREAAERDCPGLRSDTLTQDFIHAVAQSPQTQALWIINADGTLCLASDPAWMDDRNRSFRDYFIWARDAAPGHCRVGRAIIGLIDKRPAFTVAEARRKDGTFNGVLLASVSLADLVQYWEKVIGVPPAQRVGKRALYAAIPHLTKLSPCKGAAAKVRHTF
jgi:C4-dicarboxylate-specific signal transduction histidine kinase